MLRLEDEKDLFQYQTYKMAKCNYRTNTLQVLFHSFHAGRRHPKSVKILDMANVLM